VRTQVNANVEELLLMKGRSQSVSTIWTSAAGQEEEDVQREFTE